MKQVKNNPSKLGGFVLLSLAILCSACSCKRDCHDHTNPDCENYDPCYGKTKPSAKFIMEESNGFLVIDDIWIADSAFIGYMLRFRSEHQGEKYAHTWYVGNETFETSTTPWRNFGEVARPQNITISHVLEYTPDLQCFPDDNGKDSVAQIFRLVASFNDELQTYGTYRGALNGTTDTFELKILSIDENGNLANFNTHYETWFVNFHNRGDTISSTATENRISGFFYNHVGFFRPSLEGDVKVYANQTFEMTYKTRVPSLFDGNLDWNTFKGRKIK